MSHEPSYVITPAERRTILEGPLGAVLLLPSSATGGALTVLEHPLAPRALGSPIHTHQREDEYSIVLEGTVGVQIGDQQYQAGPGTVVVKPRGIPHAFWNATDQPARLLEIIAPAGKAVEHWAVSDRFVGIERAGLVVVNIRDRGERTSAERLVADVHRLRTDDAVFRHHRPAGYSPARVTAIARGRSLNHADEVSESPRFRRPGVSRAR